MIPNTDPITGIKYGTVYLNKLQPWVFEEFIDKGVDQSFLAAKKECLGDKFTEEEEKYYDDNYDSDRVGDHTLEIDEMKLEMNHLGGALLVWVMKSPHITQCRECSPCVPRAGDLSAKDEHGFDTYDLPKDWYLDE